MSVKIFIDGREGTTGLRIEERLAGRPDVRLLTIDPEKRKDESERKKLINASDITFLCLPDDAAREAVSLAENDNVRIIDASTAHRTCEDWAYGFPELSPALREKIINGKRVAVPGCHASGFIALIFPLIAAGVVPKDYPFVAQSLTGYSGGGKKMIAQYENQTRSAAFGSPRQYGLTQKHKHLPEMQKICSLDYPPIFNPVVSDYYSGMEVTVPIHCRLLDKNTDAESFCAVYARCYHDSKLIKVLPAGAGEVAENGYLAANALSGSDRLEITVCGSEDRILLISRFDNLGKGASGAAVQCMNLMLGLPEETGLNL